MKLSRRRFLWLAVGLGLAACAPKSGEPQPPEIAYDQDVCEACGMILSDARFACASVLEDGRAVKFDDIGDMIMHHLDHPDLRVKAYFVHDQASQTWIRAETAFYVMSAAIDSPMGHGIAAFEQADAAAAFARERGVSALNFDEMRVQVHLSLHS